MAYFANKLLKWRMIDSNGARIFGMGSRWEAAVCAEDTCAKHAGCRFKVAILAMIGLVALQDRGWVPGRPRNSSRAIADVVSLFRGASEKISRVPSTFIRQKLPRFDSPATRTARSGIFGRRVWKTDRASLRAFLRALRMTRGHGGAAG
jgi:hypothetical protein